MRVYPEKSAEKNIVPKILNREERHILDRSKWNLLHDASITRITAPLHWKKNLNSKEQSKVSLNSSVRLSHKNPFNTTLNMSKSKLLSVEV